MPGPERASPTRESAVARLIELGARPDIDRPEVVLDFPDLRREAGIIRRFFSEWNSVAASLSIQELENLLKGLTIAEMRFRLPGGSVSPVISVYREIEWRSPSDADRLYEWAIRRTTNRYVPTGSAGLVIPHRMVPILDEMTSEEREEWFLSYQESCRRNAEQRYREKMARLEKLEQEAEERRQARAGRKAQKQKRDRERRVARERLLEKGSRLDGIERLHLVVENPDTPLDAFPDEWAQLPDETCARMTEEERGAVISRIGYRRKGAWRHLARRLARVQESGKGSQDQPTG